MKFTLVSTTLHYVKDVVQQSEEHLEPWQVAAGHNITITIRKLLSLCFLVKIFLRKFKQNNTKCKIKHGSQRLANCHATINSIELLHHWNALIHEVKFSSLPQVLLLKILLSYKFHMLPLSCWRKNYRILFNSTVASKFTRFEYSSFQSVENIVTENVQNTHYWSGRTD